MTLSQFYVTLNVVIIMMMIKSLYNKFLRDKFFNKILIIYSLITILTIFALTYLISDKFTQIMLNQTTKFNMQILETVDTYVQSKILNFKQIIRNVYIDKSNGADVLDMLKKNDMDKESTDYIQKYSSIVAFMNGKGLSSDQEMEGIFICVKLDNYCYFSSRNLSSSLMSQISNKVQTLIANTNNMNRKQQQPYFMSQIDVNNQNNTERMYVLYYNIFDNEDSGKTLGYMASIYKSDSIKNAYVKFEKDLKGKIILTNNSGDLIFDSSEMGYGKKIPNIDKFKNSSTKTINQSDSIVNISKNNQYEFETLGLISKKELYEDISPLKVKIIIISCSSIIILIVLSYLTTVLFTKRVKNIIKAIGQIKNGNYYTKFSVGNQFDEIGQISVNLSAMSDRINDHIQKEYIHEIERKTAHLKQKEAELYALQSQINPHFLYNTLEAIRMRALTLGENEVSQMIRILATLFRNSIKDAMVVSIKDEVNYFKLYLELYSIQYGEKLKVELSIDEQIYKYGIIKHLIQPIIENSFVHSMDMNRSNNSIRIKGYKLDENIIVEISDNGKGISEQRLKEIKYDFENPYMNNNRIGLSNVNYRIKLTYGNEYGVVIDSEKDIGTTVILKIQALRKEELEDRVQSSAG
jgi:two-component system sensor histidine kinase YesM